MDCIVIEGGKPLKGDIVISGAKNAALKVMAASLLTAERLSLTNVPRLGDIASMRALLEESIALVRNRKPKIYSR